MRAGLMCATDACRICAFSVSLPLSGMLPEIARFLMLQTLGRQVAQGDRSALFASSSRPGGLDASVLLDGSQRAPCWGRRSRDVTEPLWTLAALAWRRPHRRCFSDRFAECSSQPFVRCSGSAAAGCSRIEPPGEEICRIKNAWTTSRVRAVAPSTTARTDARSPLPHQVIADRRHQDSGRPAHAMTVDLR